MVNTQDSDITTERHALFWGKNCQPPLIALCTQIYKLKADGVLGGDPQEPLGIARGLVASYIANLGVDDYIRAGRLENPTVFQ